MKILFFLSLFMVSLATQVMAQRVDPFSNIKDLMSRSEADIDLLEVKLAIDESILPSQETESTRRQVREFMVALKAMVPQNANTFQKIETVKRFLHQPGPWNGNKPFEYDLTDPLGKRIESKTLSQYIKKRKGNCVSMPIMFMILAESLGVDISLSSAPNHLLTRVFIHEKRMAFALEATSGGHFARDSHIRKQMPMSDKAIQNGIYLQRLTKKESAATMLTTLGTFLGQMGRHREQLELAKEILGYYPKSVVGLLQAGNAYYKLIETDFMTKYRRVHEIPVSERARLAMYRRKNQEYFRKAERLGWREPSRGSRDNYLSRVKRAKKGA